MFSNNLFRNELHAPFFHPIFVRKTSYVKKYLLHKWSQKSRKKCIHGATVSKSWEKSRNLRYGLSEGFLRKCKKNVRGGGVIHKCQKSLGNCFRAWDILTEKVNEENADVPGFQVCLQIYYSHEHVLQQLPISYSNSLYKLG